MGFVGICASCGCFLSPDWQGRGTERSKGASDRIEGRMILLICSRPKGHCIRHHLASHCSRRNKEQTRVSRTLPSESPEVLMEKRFRPEGSAGLGFLSSAG